MFSVLLIFANGREKVIAFASVCNSKKHCQEIC